MRCSPVGRKPLRTENASAIGSSLLIAVSSVASGKAASVGASSAVPTRRLPKSGCTSTEMVTVPSSRRRAGEVPTTRPARSATHRRRPTATSSRSPASARAAERTISGLVAAQVSAIADASSGRASRTVTSGIRAA